MTDLPTPPAKRAFDGETYEVARDYTRLKGQMGLVYHLMLDGQWRTLNEIATAVGGSEAGVSARLRDLRKPKYGALKVQRKHIQSGLHCYRLALED